ncbi:MAG: EAL domain-containing protein [Spirochaetia bacterium]|nr:EAL domain-containing protein [Spirochaetia bacterium]
MSNSVRAVINRVLFYLPLAILFLFLYSQLISFEKDDILEQVMKEHQIHLSYIENASIREFMIFNHVMEFLKSTNGVNAFIHDKECNMKTSSLFNNVLYSQKKLQYIALLKKENGEKAIAGQIGRNVEAFSLSQYNLTTQTLFYELSRLKGDDMYIHPVTFIKDEVTGLSEQMILLSSPVIEDGKIIGALVFVFEVQDAFPSMDDFIQNHSQAFTYTIVDGNGKVLNTLHRFKNLKERNPVNNYSLLQSEVWLDIKNNESGNIIVDDVVYMYKTIDPFKNSSTYYEKKNHYLIVITSFSLADLELIQSSFLLRNGPLRYIIALLLLFGSVIISLLFYFRKNDQELITLSNIISDHSQNGVLIRKPTGEVTYSNHTLELITGFNEEEILMNRLKIDFLESSPTNKIQEKYFIKGAAKQVVSYDNFAWIHAKKSYTLAHMLMNSVFNNQHKLLYLVQLLSEPQNLSRESFDTFILENKDEIAPIDLFPIKVITNISSKQKLYATMYLKLTNLDILEARYTHVQHQELGFMIRSAIVSLLKQHELLFQYSPDTFLLTITGDAEDLDRKIVALRTLFSSPFGLSHNKKILTYQGGVSVYEKDSSIATLISDSRMALATQIHFNNQGILTYNKSVNESLLRYYSILNKIPPAFKNGDIDVFFQPIVKIGSNTIIGAEALVRWNDKDFGFISPQEFIPIIEHHHLEEMLDFYVISQAVDFIVSMKLKEDDPFFISVNICPPMLFNEHLIPHIIHTLAKYKVAHKRLLIELTERTLLEDLPRANAILAELHNLGISVAIDDFGTGFSSLSYLNMLDIDVIKIDRSFIKDYPTRSEGKIIKAILTMAHELEIPTLVEGIETKEQYDFIKQYGAYTYQGFLFSKAIPLKEFKELYSRKEK